MDNPISKEYGVKDNINTENNSTSYDSITNGNDNDEKKPFFLMTLEDNTGKCQQIKIYQNTNPSELAYNFCKENNLDFSSMKYIKSNIKSIVKKFNESKQKAILYNNSNNSIKEEENEDDYLTEGTLKSNEKQKNQSNDDDNFKNQVNTDKEEDSSINNIVPENNNDDNNSNKTDTNENYFNNNKIELNKKNISEKKLLKEDKIFNNENIDMNNKYSKSIKLSDKECKNKEAMNPHIKFINNIGKIPIKINQISPKQIEINENIQKIINSGNKSTKDNENQNNIMSLYSEKNNNFITSTERHKNNAYISIFDKEIKDNLNSLKSKEKNKTSDLISNNPINSNPKLSEIIYNKKDDDDKKNDNTEEENKEDEKEEDEKKEDEKKEEEIKEEENKEDNNKNFFNKDNRKIEKIKKNRPEYINFDLNYFGENYIKKSNKNENELSKKISQSADSIESGVPVLNNDIDIESDNNTFNKGNISNKLSLNKNDTKNNGEIKEETCNLSNINKYDNKNKEILINKMKKLEFNLPKKNNRKNNEINKLLYLIKNSCYNINKNIRNKVIKDKTNDTDMLDINKIKMKYSNSLDINYEISRNLENEPNNIYTKILNNNISNNISNNININANTENNYKNNNYINTNFNAYIENNKINNKKNNNNNNNNINTSNNKSHPNNTNSLNRKYFFSNPDLSSNQEGNGNNGIYNIKHDFKNLRKNGLSSKSKSKSLGKDKSKKTSSTSKNKILPKKYTENINTRIKAKNLIKEKTKRLSLNFKNKFNLNKNNLTTPNTIDVKRSNYLKLKSCQTPPTKRTKNADHKINTIFSEWLMSTINRDSRNVYTTRDHYFKKKKKVNKTGKSVSELTDTEGKKSHYRILLSKSNFKKIKPNYIAKNIKLDTKNKVSKDSNKNSKKKNNYHCYIHSLKMINTNDTRHNNHLNKNCINTININKNINCKKLTSINKTLSKKQFKRIKHYNIINTINDYNFNNNSNIKKFINNTFHNFKYDSTENSKSEDKLRKITTQKQLTSLPKSKYIGIRSNKTSSNKIVEYKYSVNKNPKIILDNSGSNQSYLNDNGSNININNLININNYQKNKNFNNNKNGSNHCIKNSRFKKNKIINKLKNNNTNIITNNKRLVNFSNELTNYYLNTEIYKNNINNLTYSNFISNNLTLNNFDISSDEKITEENLINIFNKIFIFFNKDKLNEIVLLDSFYKKRMTLFPENIRRIIHNMIEILCKNMRKKNNISNNSITNSIKNNNDNIIKIDKNNFINEMLYIYKYYLTNENKKVIISNREDINKIIHENFLDRSFYKISKNNNNNKNDIIYPKSYKKQYQYKTKTESKNST